MTVAPRIPTPLPLVREPSPIHELTRLRARLGGPRVLLKRDDTIGFAFGGNKVRKLAYVAAAAIAEGADTLVTCGGVQSNHARVTAVTAAAFGLDAILVLNGAPPDPPTGNALLDRLAGAAIVTVARPADRAAAMEDAAARARRAGRRPRIVPLGASEPLGVAAFAAAASELLAQIDPPDVIVHATSSGGTQAGLIAGLARAGCRTQVLGISADEPSAALTATIRRLLDESAPLLGMDPAALARRPVDVDDRFTGPGYGIPTEASRAAIETLARTEGVFLDPTYTAKAMAGLLALVEAGAFDAGQTVVFWHTGGQVGLFA
jgi:D-cysteine desulfhydrase